MGSRRRPSLTTLVQVLLCLYHAPRMALSLSFNLNFSDPGVPNRGASINFAGQAFLSSSALELTTNTSDANIQYSTSRASYVHKVPLWNSATGETASFTTTFSFRITPDRDSPSSAGDGMAFFLGHFPSVIPPKSEGGSLGLLPALTNGTGDTRIVAVEFDTFLNPQNADMNGNHVGIDVNSVNSTASTDTTTIPGRNLTSSHVMTATVKYHNGSRLLAVDLLIGDALYQVNATIDLRRYLPEEVAIGFSAATGWAAELHQILSWSFSSTLQLESRLESNMEAPPPAQLPPPTSNKHKMLVVTLLSVLVPLLFLSVCVAMVTIWRRHEKRRSKRANGDSSSDSDDEEHCVDRAVLERGVAAGGPKRYTYHELVAATSNFAEEEKLGRGGFGSVYRGHLTLAVAGGDQERRAVAVKMLSAESSAQGRKEFEAEVRIISRLKHRNLVQLLGWCDSRKGLLLVYELVAEGSLDRHLYSKDGFLTWPQRYKIILGLGSALRYLHGEWEQSVVHGDIKPSNIMLDASHCTKLGDFGLARLVDHGAGLLQTTKAVLGTAGYIDPEFVNTRRPSTESDVYSFGVVLLEIVSGRRPVVETAEISFTLLRWVWSLYGRDAVLDAADERLRGDEADEWWMERVLVVGLWCAHPDRSERPSVAQAMNILQSEEARLPALPFHMYRTVPELESYGRHGAFSTDGTDCVGSSLVNTGDATLSSDSSPIALLRRSKDLAN
ncbi:L-type lectin-domain containing receptor kinase IX.1-like [Aegilops tauschii subsp. strangulata]|uniref:non-specific serine/threonine protein kinase n=1 Tax=Aegilops tauschii subsp. strangulata TaxID=200361 RepID=A0A453JXN6_AEGTS|nr:L-type lectin-domain containing receptor kinase IX.1-like [Aegilops tauschii subsp. strangulata]